MPGLDLGTRARIVDVWKEELDCRGKPGNDKGRANSKTLKRTA